MTTTPFLAINEMGEFDNNKYLIHNNAVLNLEDATQRVLAVDTTAGATVVQSDFTTRVNFRCSGHTGPQTLFVPAQIVGTVTTATNRLFVVENLGTDDLTVDQVGSPGATITLAAGDIALVYADGTDVKLVGGTGGGGGSTTFSALTDTPANFTGSGGFSTRVNSGETALEFIDEPVVPALASGTPLQVLRQNAGGTALEYATVAGGGAIPTQDDGVQIVATPTAHNFKGSGVSVVDNSNIADITIPGAGVAWQGARASLTSAQTITGGVIMSWEQEDLDIGGWFDLAGNPTRLTVPTGVTKVRVSANIATAGGAADQTFMQLYKNGVASPFPGSFGTDTDTAGQDNLNGQSAVLDVVPGDFFELRVFSTNADTAAATGLTWFAIEAVEGINGATSGIIQTIDCVGNPQPQYDITGIDQYDEIRIIADGLNLGANQIKLRVSTDGGGTFLSAATDYENGFLTEAGTGGNSSANSWDITATSFSTPQGFVATVSGMGLLAPTTFEADTTQDGGSIQRRRRGMTDTTAVVDALRIFNGGAVNFTAGTIYVVGISYGSGGGGGSAIETQDDGVQVVTATDTINFKGSGVDVTNPSGNVTDVEIVGAGLPWTGARVELTSVFAMPATPTIVDWDQVDREVGGPWWAGGNPSRLTVPAGVTKVRVKANAFSTLGAGGEWRGEILLNGATFSGMADLQVETANDSVLNMASDVIDVVPGDFFELRLSSPTGGDLNANDGSWFSIEAVEGIAASAGVGFFATQNVLNPAGVQIFEQEVFDLNANYDNTTGVFTAPVSGLYSFAAGAQEDNGYTGSVDLYVRVNGVNYAGMRAFSTNLGNDGHTVATTIQLNAGDTVDVFTNFITANAAAPRSYFGGYLINQSTPAVLNVGTEPGLTRSSSLGDAGALIRTTNATSHAYTVEPDVTADLPIGTVISLVQEGAGQITLVAGAGVTINTASSLTSRAQHSLISVTKLAANLWVAAGDLT